MQHTSVLLHETIDLLNVKPDGIYVDGTLGRGGHAGALISKLTTGHLYAFDKDEQALKESAENLAGCLDRVTMIHSDFRSMKEELQKRGIIEVDGIMLDLGADDVPTFMTSKLGTSDDGPVITFGTARGEIDFLRFAT